MASSKLGYETVEGEQNNNYVFSSGGYAASARLNLQYYLFEWQTGYQLSPLISTDRENLRIADVGTGSGIWLVNLSSKVPASATLDAFDVTKDLFPRPESLPLNVKFNRLDIFEPIPEDFIGKYDIVHVRFFTPVVGQTGPVPVIKAAMQLLKPGGVLQWDEREVSLNVVPGQGGKTEAMVKLRDTMEETFKNMKVDHNWVTSLGKVFDSCGLVDVKIAQHPIPKTMHGYLLEFLLQTVEEACFGIDRMVGKGAGDDVRAKIAAAYEEHRLYGSTMEADMVVCIGRKAE